MDRLGLALVARRADDQEVGVGDQAADVEGDDVGGLFVVGDRPDPTRELFGGHL